ncbi:MAG TPA: DNA primase, partial [Candidatus Omnitrophota bacterium]|nr:DNA primase [Candidatus Omnitrophota bacterium]
ILLPQRRRDDRRADGTVTQIHKINEAAAAFYQSSLRSARAKSAHRYLDNRGITPHTARTFRLGYAPDEWDGLARHLTGHAVDLELAQKAGLVIAGKDRGFYDRFRDRIVFPITDVRSAVIGFGARVLDKSLPKYINSPETPVYVKGNHLYGLDLAKDAIRKEDRAVVVEGYLDCIMPYQAGMHNIVASLGTALTPQQVRLLKRYTHNVCLVYDGDMAGQAASIRCLEIFIDEGINLTVAVLPEGFDPDSFTASRGIDAFRELAAGAATIFDYKLKFLIEKTGKIGTESKAAVVSDMLSTIARFRNAVLRSEYVKRLSEALDVDESALLTELSRVKSGIRADEPAAPGAVRPSAVHPAEKLLIKLMLEESSLIDQVRDRLDPDDFQDSRTSRIVRLMLEMTASGKPLAPGAILNHVGSDETMRLVCESTFLPDVPETQKRVIVEDCIARLKNARQASRRQRLQS